MKKDQFIKLYDQYAPRIYRFIYLKVNSSEDSEDLTSESFFKFWQSIKEGNKKINNPRALLYRIANNLVIDFYRKKSRTEITIDEDIPDKTDLSQKADLASDMEQVKKALKQMKGKHQDVIIWHYLDELSPKEIAQITGKSEGAVRVLIHRAMVCLRNEVQPRKTSEIVTD